jgi:hypothetical protein
MTTALGIAAVTATLRDLLRNGIIEHNLVGLLGVSVAVSALPPDRVLADSGKETSQLNLFMYRVSGNPGWRNEGLPARDSSGRQRLTNPPMGLDLHYLLTAYCAEDLHADVLLGFAMQWLHLRPVLTREMIRTALAVSSPPGTPLERALAAAGLADQIELVKLTPEYVDTEEMSKLWTATQTNLRPTAAYRASVLLIEAEEPVRAPLPVLTRGAPLSATGRDEGIFVQASLDISLPTLTEIVPHGGQPVARPGEEVVVLGSQLAGSNRQLRLVNDRFQVEHLLPENPGGDAGEMRFTIPVSAPLDFPAGIYSVGANLTRPGETMPRESNYLALTLAPQILGLPLMADRDDDNTVRFTLTFFPAARVGQRIALILGEQEYTPEPFTTSTTSLDFVIANAPISTVEGFLARLRIDGIDSPIVDYATQPPQFFNHRIVMP